MTQLVFYLLVFFVVGVFFLFFHLMLGKLIRPAKPEPDKLTIYECGEPTIGSAWVQFDLRYYVVALLFVIFDVEVAFFFPWAVVFGDANRLANPNLDSAERAAITQHLVPITKDARGNTVQAIPPLQGDKSAPSPIIDDSTAYSWGIVAFVDILVFFGVLMVGFAYLWRRGDINWVRSTAAEAPPAAAPELPVRTREQALVGAGRP
jgi:NADH-quinone oxidoreductase subunit A